METSSKHNYQLSLTEAKANTVRDEFRNLADSMRSCLNDLEEPGRPLPLSLLESAQAASRKFDELRLDVRKLMEYLSISSPNKSKYSELTDLKSIELTLSRIRKLFETYDELFTTQVNDQDKPRKKETTGKVKAQSDSDSRVEEEAPGPSPLSRLDTKDAEESIENELQESTEDQPAREILQALLTPIALSSQQEEKQRESEKASSPSDPVTEEGPSDPVTEEGTAAPHSVPPAVSNEDGSLEKTNIAGEIFQALRIPDSPTEPISDNAFEEPSLPVKPPVDSKQRKHQAKEEIPDQKKRQEPALSKPEPLVTLKALAAKSQKTKDSASQSTSDNEIRRNRRHVSNKGAPKKSQQPSKYLTKEAKNEEPKRSVKTSSSEPSSPLLLGQKSHPTTAFLQQADQLAGSIVSVSDTRQVRSPLPRRTQPSIRPMRRRTAPSQANRATQPLFCFGTFFSEDFDLEFTAAQIAYEIRSRSQFQQRDLLSLTVRLIDEGSLDMAYQLSRCIELRWPGDGKTVSSPQAVLPSILLRCLVFSSAICGADGQLADILAADLAALDCRPPKEELVEWNRGISWMLTAATLRPALIAPTTTGAAVILDLLWSASDTRLGELSRMISDHVRNHRSVRPEMLDVLFGQAEWKKSLEELQSETWTWWEHERSMTTPYFAADKVWEKWQQRGQLIHRVLTPVLQNEIGDLENFRKEISRLLRPNNLRKEVDRTDHRILGRTRKNDIRYRALEKLTQKALEALVLARRWIALQDTRGPKDSNSPLVALEHLQQALSTILPACRAEVETCRYAKTSAERAGASCVARTLDDLKQLLGLGGTSLRPSLTEFGPQHLINVEPLRLPGIPLNDEGELASEPQDIWLSSLLTIASDRKPRWQEHFDGWIEKKDYITAGRIIDYLRVFPDPKINVKRLERLLEHCRDETRRALKEKIRRCELSIEHGVALGMVGEEERLDLIGRLEAIQMDLHERLGFTHLEEDLRGITHRIERFETEARGTLDKRLREIQVLADDITHQYIQKAIENGEFLAANEYLERLRKGEPIELMSSGMELDIFEEFFPSFLSELENYLRQHKPRDFQGALQRGEIFGSIELSRVPGAQRKQGRQIIDTWLRCKAMGQQPLRLSDTEDLRTIFEWIGFSVRTLEVKQHKGREVWLDLHTETLANRRDCCPIPSFGSEVRGHYMILCVWDRPSEESLLRAIGSAAWGNVGYLVLHFGRMTERRRRDLAVLCRLQRRSVLLVDDTLFFYLCCHRGDRLPIFFRCTLPFTYARPYRPDASEVPPEMFYGREHQHDLIKEAGPTCLIYGGRRLGKTVLLRAVARAFHKPENLHFAKWIDLRQEEIANEVDAIWHMLVKTFKHLGILDEDLPEHDIRQAQDGIRVWLEAHPKARILLLLDESDLFLVSDGLQNFQETVRFKSLMDTTEYRFKVVFAGLHNLYRTTTQSNNPLVQFRDPICIGPLLDRGEWRNAREMVRIPFESLGFRFKNPDLITRILSETNYYPNLIQHYCADLLEHAHKQVAEGHREGPPYRIDSQDLEAVYESQELREAVRLRFFATLGLDSRYEFITYLIAHGIRAAEPERLARGFPITWIKEMAAEYWAGGFQQGSSFQKIDALLHEMVGLGVLRQVGEDCYTLRTSNIFLLLGSEDEIERKVLEDRTPPPGFRLETLRSAYRSNGQPDPFRRHPLTASDLALLRGKDHGIVLVYGTEAAGLSELGPFLSLPSLDHHYTFLEAPERSYLTDRLEDIEVLRPSLPHLFHVAGDCAWDPEWFDAIWKILADRPIDSTPIRVIFEMSPLRCWEFGYHSFRAQRLHLQPWHDDALHQWLESLANVGIDVLASERQRIPKIISSIEVTGSPACSSIPSRLCPSARCRIKLRRTSS